MPASPSMNVIDERQEAVLTKPGSSVTRPVSFRRFDTSYASLPSEARTSGHFSSMSPARSTASAVSIVMKKLTSLYTGSIAGSERHKWGCRKIIIPLRVSARHMGLGSAVDLSQGIYHMLYRSGCMRCVGGISPPTQRIHPERYNMW